MKFKVNDTVVCVDDRFTDQHKIRIPNLPKLGNYYKIRATMLTPRGEAVLLQEISNPMLDDGQGQLFEPSFSVARFEKIKPEDIADLDIAMDELLEELERPAALPANCPVTIDDWLTNFKLNY